MINSSANNTRAVDKVKLLKWIFSIMIPLAIQLIPESATLTPVIKAFLSITFWAVFCWATEILPNALVAILLPVLYILFQVAKPEVVFSPWSSTSTWIALGGMIIASVLMASGLAKRIAYWTILKTGVSYKGTIIGMMISGMIITPFVPSILGKIAIFVPIAISICEALDLKPKSKAATGILLAAFLSVASPATAFLTGNGGIPMVMNLVEKVSHTQITWLQYAFHNLPLYLIWTPISVFIVIIALKPEKKFDAKDVILEKYKELGPMSSQEKKVCVLLVAILIALITEPYHKINSAWSFIILSGICFLPGVNLMNDEQLGKINYRMIFFFTGCMALGSAAVACGAGKWIADLLFPYLVGSPLHTLLSVWGLGVALNFILTPMAGYASFTVPLSQMAVQAGIDPVVVIYSFMQGLDQYIFPYEFAVLLFVYSFGYMSFKYMAKVISIKMVLNAVFIAAVLYPYWKLIGLM